jgi:hypothetical protein
MKYYVEEICSYKRGAFVEANSHEEAEEAFIDYAQNPETDLDIYGENSEIIAEEVKTHSEYDVVINEG